MKPDGVIVIVRRDAPDASMHGDHAISVAAERAGLAARRGAYYAAAVTLIPRTQIPKEAQDG
jgi:hypothetical protein